MAKEIPDRTDSARMAEDLRNTPDGLFLRYCRARLRYLALRQILTVTGGLTVSVLGGPLYGLIATVLALLGEAVDCLVLRAILQRCPAPPVHRLARRKATASAAFQALTIAGAAGVALASARPFEADFFVAAFLAAAVINAGLTLPHHSGSAVARIAIHLAALATLAIRNLVHILHAPGAGGDLAYDLMGIAVLMIAVGGFVSFVRGAHRRQQAYDRVLAAERACLEAQQDHVRRLALVAEHASDSIVITQGNGRITWVNDTFSRITGYSLDEAIGHRPGELLNAPETNPDTVRALVNAHRRKLPLRTEVLNRRKDGSVIWMETSLTPIFNPDGSHAMTIGVERDITAMKEREAELARARKAAEDAASIKSRFLATMSHEIRTPLNGVIGMAQLLRETELDTDQKHSVETIAESGRALLSIINDILDLARMQSGKSTIRAEPFSVEHCARGVIDLLRPLAQEKGLELSLFLDGRIPRLVGDQGRIRQILLNLVGNAIKFTHRGQVQVAVQAMQAGAAVQLRVRVEDTGIGIAPDRIEHVFDSFTQADGDITRRYGGTGLGLTISRLLAREMGGDITVRSTLGLGSAFDLALVLNRAAEVPDAATPGGLSFHSHRARGLRVLVAEDNATNRLIVGKMLAGTGAEVAFAENGFLAVERSRVWRPSVVLMDISMPGMDGIQAARCIRADERMRGDRPIRIVALTANAFEEDRDACAAAGFDGFLPKPISKAALLECLSGLTG
ncbi:ATP-binding protein [Defluviimonas sp. WL0002]|uniref:histidine kinase n=1 Tax=Albidovulum marisflavi TaxID=2984159 RepID=A0ABT2Z862_9RHOB|nr:ATP-binding protein [Defluviimonas sp. WL0002]MCV2867323.1 ATP-binding protein [Defluviimonas sp. WL0002]